MALNIYLLRHAEAQHNVTPHIIGGQSNHVDLSDRGLLQAVALANRLRIESVEFDSVYSSTALRTCKTAQLVCRLLGFPEDEIVKSDKLLELDQGRWEGKDKRKMYTLEVQQQMRDLNWRFRAPGGESQKDVEERVYSWINRTILEKTDRGNVCIFGHGVAFKCLIRKIMNSDPKLTYRINIDNCSITQFRYITQGHHAGWHPVRLNDVGHLHRDQFTSASYV